MNEQELFVLAVAIGVAIIAARVIANRFKVPEAILLVLLGVAASLIPQVPNIHLPPGVVLLVFLPPLIYNAAFFSAPRETKENAVPITALAVGATLITMVVVAGVTRATLPAISWPAALALGAAVAPTDAVAATSILQRLGAPPRIVTILEGESLINDGVALTAFGLAVEAMSEPFSVGRGLLRLVEVVVGGVGYGLVVAWLIGRVRRRVRDPGVQILVSLLTPFVAYIPAEELHFSGVLATVAAGVYLSTRTEGLLQPASRLTGAMFWRTLTFLLESALFVLLGLELRATVEDLAGGHPAGRLVVAAIAVVVATVVVRLAWELAIAPISRFIPGRHADYVRVAWRRRLVIGWGGMRGAISLAIALSLPLTVGGAPFAERGTLIFLAAAVVVATLIGQGLTLTPLLRVLGLARGDADRTEEARARQVVMESALARLDELAEDERIDPDAADTYRQLYEMRLDRVRALLDDDASAARSHREGAWLRRQLTDAQRSKLRDLYDRGKIGIGVYRTLGAELDAQEPRTHLH